MDIRNQIKDYTTIRGDGSYVIDSYNVGSFDTLSIRYLEILGYDGGQKHMRRSSRKTHVTSRWYSCMAVINNTTIKFRVKFVSHDETFSTVINKLTKSINKLG